VEASKLSMKGGSDAEKNRATTILLDILEKSLRLLHPLLPFVTEEIYQKLISINNGQGLNINKMLLTCRYPEYDEKLANPEEEKMFSLLQALVGMVRTIRSECGIQPAAKLRVLVRSKMAEVFKQNEELIKLLAGISELQIEDEKPGAEKGAIGLAGTGFEVFVFVAEAVDTAALKKKFTGDLEKDQKYIDGLRAKLANEQFVKNAPPELVEEQKGKLEEAVKRTDKLKYYLKDL
jgi:valyl-tRNA synthetase